MQQGEKGCPITSFPKVSGFPITRKLIFGRWGIVVKGKGKGK